MRSEIELQKRLFFIRDFMSFCREVKVEPGNEIIVFKLVLEWVLQDLGETPT